MRLSGFPWKAESEADRNLDGERLDGVETGGAFE